MSASLIAMMPAMMLPALAPAAMVVRRTAFVAGYLAVWAAVGVLAYVAAGAVMLDGHGLAAAVLVGAALYQLTPAKAACLERCRDPSSSGLRHGVACVACCAPLVAALFALGVMSLGWMLAVAALIAAERVLPWPRQTAYGVAAVLVVCALAGM